MPELKTNAMRLLDTRKIPYRRHSYPCGGQALDGVTVAGLLGWDPARVFKTLITQGGREHYVFVIPACRELDLKKAARAAGVKSVELISVNEINRVTGYVRGGCSPLCMKKAYPTYFDQSARQWGTILVSAGKIGHQIEAAPDELAQLCGGQFAGLTEE